MKSVLQVNIMSVIFLPEIIKIGECLTKLCMADKRRCFFDSRCRLTEFHKIFKVNVLNVADHYK